MELVGPGAAPLEPKLKLVCFPVRLPFSTSETNAILA